MARTQPQVIVEDVHNSRDWFDKGIDLILREGDRVETVDLKVDSYFGKDPKKRQRGFYNLDSGVLLLETTSQLRYDRTDLERHPDVPGWFFTSKADTIFYYYVAIETSATLLRDILARRRGLETVGSTAELIDRELLSKLEVERDELLWYSLKVARSWFSSAPESAFEGWAGAGNPGYVTVSRRLKRSYFLNSGWGNTYGSIIGRAREIAPSTPQ